MNVYLLCVLPDRGGHDSVAFGIGVLGKTRSTDESETGDEWQDRLSTRLEYDSIVLENLMLATDDLKIERKRNC